jgi:iron complex transport system substrate-binding protein
VILPPNRELAQVPDKVRSVAAALGVPGRGDELAASIEDEVAAATDKAASVDGKPRAVVLYLRGASTQMIFGKGAGTDQLLVAAGATDAAGEVGINGTVPITPEALVQLQPDVIVVTTTGLQSVGGIDGLLAIPGIAQTAAGQNRRVLAYEDQFLLGGGPRIGQTLTQLVGDLHGGA